MSFAGHRRAIAWGAFGSVCLTPFLFATVTRREWIGLCQLWIALGLLCSAGPKDSKDPGFAVFQALLPFHLFFAVQLVPLPAFLLRQISAGAFAAHFLPDPGTGEWQPISVSPPSTVDAWIYAAGLQGLFLALQGLPRFDRRRYAHAVLGVILLLAAEGLWQSRSAHPYWLLGRTPVIVPQGLETSIFGPYLNRNHFATVMAMGAGLAAGAATGLGTTMGSLARLLGDPSGLPRLILLSGSCGFLVLASAASGSRSGTLAALVAVAMILARAFGERFVWKGLVLGGVAVAALALSGAPVIDRLLNLEFGSSRLRPWADMTTLLRFFPIFGSGIGTFSEAYWPYQSNATYEIWPYAHNDYLQWMIEGGICGLLTATVAIRALRRTVSFSTENRELGLGTAIAFGAQALLDFPSHVLANAALVVCVLAISAERRPVGQ